MMDVISGGENDFWQMKSNRTKYKKLVLSFRLWNHKACPSGVVRQTVQSMAIQRHSMRKLIVIVT